MIHSACLLWSISFCPSSLSMAETFSLSTPTIDPPSLLGFGYLRRWLAFCTMGMWSWSMIKVMRVVNHRCPMDSMSFGIPSLESPPPSPSFPAIDVSMEVPLDPLVDGTRVFAVAPRYDRHHIPHPEAHWVMVNFGTESRKVIMKVARRACAGQTLPLSASAAPCQLPCALYGWCGLLVHI